MNPIDQNEYGRDDSRFDLLVDGELSESERRELLIRLDDEPGGWRRCVGVPRNPMLAGGARFDGSRIVRATFAETARRRLVPAGGVLGTLLAMAACFLVALFLVFRLQQMWHGPAGGGLPSMEVAEGTSGVEEPTEQPPQPQPPHDVPPETPQRPDVPSSPWQMVTLGPAEGPDGQAESVRLPAIEREQLDQRWLQGLPAAIPEEVLQALQQSGHQIRQRRQWVPLQMQDGRRLVVPVEEVDVHYVGRPAL